jgi:hypothetical protein
MMNPRCVAWGGGYLYPLLQAALGTARIYFHVQAAST